KAGSYEDEAPAVEVSTEELNLAKHLIEASTTKNIDLAKYKDVYTEKLTKLIEAKVAGEELVAPPPTEHPDVINLWDALKKSLAMKQEAATPTKASKKPAKKMAASVDKKQAAARKKKTG